MFVCTEPSVFLCIFSLHWDGVAKTCRCIVSIFYSSVLSMGDNQWMKMLTAGWCVSILLCQHFIVSAFCADGDMHHACSGLHTRSVYHTRGDFYIVLDRCVLCVHVCTCVLTSMYAYFLCRAVSCCVHCWYFLCISWTECVKVPLLSYGRIFMNQTNTRTIQSSVHEQKYGMIECSWTDAHGLAPMNKHTRWSTVHAAKPVVVECSRTISLGWLLKVYMTYWESPDLNIPSPKSLTHIRGLFLMEYTIVYGKFLTRMMGTNSFSSKQPTTTVDTLWHAHPNVTATWHASTSTLLMQHNSGSECVWVITLLKVYSG